MARKRKIPARKHHGVRDPLKQLETREKKLQNVVNNPPERGNDQKVSFKFAQFKKLADAAKTGKKVKRLQVGKEDKPKVHNKNNSKSATTLTNKKLKAIRQFEDETDRNYMRRINRVAAESLREAQYEAKYGVKVLRDTKTGAITVQKQPKHELDELLKQKMKERHAKKGRKVEKPKTKPEDLIDTKTAKELIKRVFKEDKEEKKKEIAESIEYKHDEIKFGEIVHAPPILSVLPRKAEKSETVPRPGKKNNLLLKSLISENNDSNRTSSTRIAKQKKVPFSSSIAKAQRQGKRKDLPAVTRHMLETEQSKLIEHYRQLKKVRESASN